ncbi:MAG: Ribulokinase [Chloroflexi bacterium ADurb.Bin325]|nr:MAG: Ribulokinase [Chloroflexi bacterium ADurb.Bin325]
MPKYVIGVDFGTESGRALLVDVADGREVATSVHPYANGVLDERLPADAGGVRLEPDWALQDPNDYLEVLKHAIPAVLAEGGASPEDVIGLGIDFTACTMLPTKADGTPLCFLPEYRSRPHAWVKLWKHHAAQPEANKLNEIARRLGYAFLDRYGGKISSEWFVPKAWQILDEDPEIYEHADRLLEAADWVVWQLTGVETRNLTTAGYKGIWSKHDGFPPNEFFRALDPRLERLVDDKLSRKIAELGQRAGGLTEQAAAWTGLRPDTAVAVANVDAHVAVPAATVTEAGRMVIIMGTSNCHMVLGTEERIVPGMCGYVEDGIIPGFFGYEAGQSCVGDHFAWFTENCVLAAYEREAEARGLNIHQLLEEKAAALQPGESGLLALDWWNGNRSVLVDVDLTGLLLGMTLLTRPEEIYRALIEATAYGTRVIIEAFAAHDVPVHEIVATGGLPDRNRLLMQIYADVTGRPIKVARTHQGGALGAAMHGAVAAGAAAGGYATIVEAARHMAGLRADQYEPNPDAKQVYDQLYAEYVTLHDYFGRGANDVMKRLKNLKAAVRG